MNPPNSDSPLKPLSTDAEVFTLAHTPSINPRTPEALLHLKEAAMAAAMDGIALWEKGRHLDLNSQYVQIFGYNDVQELRGQPWQILYEPEAAKRIEQHIIPILNSVGYWQGEAIAKRKNGSTFVAEISLTRTEDEIFLCICRNISQRKQAEQEQERLIAELKRSNAILQAQQEATLEGLLILDENRQVISYNTKFGQLWQIPPTLGNPTQKPEFLRFILDQLASPREFIHQLKLISQNQKQVIKDEVQLKDGRIFEYHNAPLCSQQGDYYGQTWLFRDVSDRKKIEVDLSEPERIKSELKRSQSLLQAILDYAPLGIYVKDLEGRYILVNHAIEELFQVKQADWIGKTNSEVIPAVCCDSIPNDELRILEQGQPIHLEETVIFQGEERHFVTVKFPLLNESQQPYAICGISTDITDFKETEKELKNQTNFLQSIWDHINYSIFILDVLNDGEDFRFASFNPAALRSSNQPLQRFIGQTVKQVFPEEMVKLFLPRYAQVVHSGESISFEEKFLTEYNSTWWFITLAPLKDAAGNVYQIVATSEDITERKRAEEKLKVQQNQIKYLLNNIPHMAWLKNQQGQFVAVNQSLSRRFGLTPEQMIGKTNSDLVDAEFAQKIFTDDPQIITSTKQQRIEIKIVDRQGQTCWLEIYNHPIMIDQNQRIGTVGIAVDITELKYTEKWLIQQARREKILNQLTTQIRKSLDFDTILQTTLVSVKQCLAVDRCGFFLYYPHLEEPCWKVIQDCHREDLPDFKGQIFSAAVTTPVTERALNAEVIRIIDADLEVDRAFRQVLRTTKTKSMLGIPLKIESGQFGLLTCTIHQNKIRNWTDEEVSLLQAVVEQLAIALKQAELYKQTQTKAQELEQAMHELHRTQAQMIQNEKMSSLGQLVAGVAHEINNPVSFIYGNLTHAKDYANDLLTLVELYQKYYPNPVAEIEAELGKVDLEFLIEDLPKLINSMQNGAERIKKIVESLRTFSRLDEAELKIIDLHEGIDSALMIVESRLYKKRERPAIKVIKEYGNIPRIQCYAGYLNQVFFNLLTNAIDALEESLLKSTENGQTFDHPQIRIRTELTSDRQVMIAITNNGLGIPPEVQEQIFNPFFTTKPVGKGTGMGLSICYQIITEKHGGSIECISQPEQGTEMIIRIPSNS